MAKTPRLKLGARKILRLEGWVSTFVKPGGKFWKRIAAKKARRYADEIPSGAAYRKTWGPFEWS